MGYNDKKRKRFIHRIPALLALGSAIFLGTNWYDDNYGYDSGLQSPAQVQQVLQNKNASKEKDSEDKAVLVFTQPRSINPFSRSVEGDVQSAYDALKNRGYVDKNIILFTNVLPKGRPLNEGVNARPIKENLNAALKYAANNSNPQSSTIFFFEGHGDKNKGESTIELADSGMTQKEFRALIEPIKGEKVLVFDQCYSGGFIDELKNIQGKKTIIAATGEDRVSVAGSERGFWENIGKGQKVTTAFKSAYEEGKNKVIIQRVYKAVTGAENTYIILDGGADIAHRNSDGGIETKVLTTQPFSHNLQGKLIPSLFIFLASISLILSLKFRFTANAIGNSGNHPSEFLFVSIIFFFLFFLTIFGKSLTSRLSSESSSSGVNARADINHEENTSYIRRYQGSSKAYGRKDLSESERLRRELEPEVRYAADQYIKQFSDKTGIAIKKKPEVKLAVPLMIRGKIVANNPLTTAYSPSAKTIIINYENIGNRGSYGEEIGHYVRRSFNPNSKEKLTNEFFGYVGKRIISRDKIPQLDKVVGTKREVLDQLATMDKNHPARRNILEHYRGYEFAEKLDLSKIKNWKKFFSLPDKEVRRRFFREDQDYSSL